jgi:CRISPR-associated protein Csm4
VEKAPRVTVDRLTNSSGIFYMGRLHFQTDCGFWFGLQWNQPDRLIEPWQQTVQQAVHQAFDLLADVGLGGERSAGYGHFAWEPNDVFSLPDARPDRPFVTLSRYHPRPEELPQALRGERTAYRLVSIGGWLQAPGVKAQRRRRLLMIEEGSIVQAVGQPPWGDVQDVRPSYEDPDFPAPTNNDEFPHPIWRYGLACPVGFGGAV